MALDSPGKSGSSLQEAAASLGVPVDALRIYLASHPSSSGTDSISPSQLEALQSELRSRAGSLSLDALAKTSLTIEWLASAALENRKVVDAMVVEVADARTSVDPTPRIETLEKTVVSLGEDVKKASSQDNGSTMQVVGSLQSMFEAQGRELDSLRVEIAALKELIAAGNTQHQKLVSSLLSALQGGGPVAATGATSGKASAPTPSEDRKKQAQPATVVKEVAVEAPRFTNTEVKEPVKPGVKREIEYNFLLERMGFKRLDSYSDEELKGDVKAPQDDAIKAFLGKYELGVESEEVDFVNVQRGEFQMIQYQRVDKSTGLRGWMPAKRSK